MSSNADWWRFTGVSGFKQFMSDRAIQAAKVAGHAWVRWYEPVCKTCHPLLDSVPVTVVDIETSLGDVVVKRVNGLYTVSVAGVDRHPNADADSALRALGHYLHGTDYALQKLQGRVKATLDTVKTQLKDLE